MIVRMGSPAFNVTVNMPMTECMDEYGPRFDTLGAITSISVDGVEHCTREGLIDEFNIQAPYSPPGYDEAKPGGTFLKIGVGELVRPDEAIYLFYNKYPIRKIAPVVIREKKNEVDLKQICRIQNGWGYEYCKNIIVHPEKSVLEISYSLKNIGSHVIKAEHYNHNWFSFGSDGIDGAYSINHSFQAIGPTPKWLREEAGQFHLAEKISKPYFYRLDRSVTADENAFTLRHKSSGQSVRTTGNFDVSRFAIYADQSAICPEVFACLAINPGETKTWKNTYEFLKNGHA